MKQYTMNWIANERMQGLFDLASSLKEKGNTQLHISLHSLKNLFLSTFKQIDDCIIIAKDENTELVPAIDYSFLKRTYGDFTGYEAANNETRINDFFENELSAELGVAVALLVADIWALRLKAIEPKSMFCLILSCNNNQTMLRFHKIRQNEKMWLSENIEGYQDEAVGYSLV